MSDAAAARAELDAATDRLCAAVTVHRYVLVGPPPPRGWGIGAVLRVAFAAAPFDVRLQELVAQLDTFPGATSA